MVAHELASPLIALYSYSSTLQQEGLNAALYARIGASILEVVERTGRFVDDLRDAARLGRGSFELRREPTDFVALGRQVVDYLRCVISSTAIPPAMLASNLPR